MRLDLRKLVIFALAIAPSAIFARTVAPGPPTARTGLAADGGLACSACHRTADGGTAPNTDARAKLTITAANYTPGAKQKITVKVEHPEATRWGFQLTARLESDPTKAAGTFIGNDTVFVRCGLDNTPAGIKQGSCNGEIEFVNHTAASTAAGTPGSATWEFEWQAPESVVGKVLFSAAGNAANNNNNNQGDSIVTNTLSIDRVAANGPKPAITARGVADAFTYGANIASQGWFTIAGSNLAPGIRTWDDAISAGKLPTSLSGVSVKINNKLATIFYVSPGQINGLAPLDDATGMVPVVVSNINGDSDPMMVNKTAAAPAFFAPFAQGGRFFIRAQATDGTWLGKTGVDTEVRRAVRPGETVAIFGTGFGATNPAVEADTIPASPAELRAKPTLRLGTTALTFTGNGSLVLPGLYRFDVTIPAGTAAGDIALTAEIGTVTSANTVFLTVAP